ncbi:glucuronate isomerase [Jeotgalibacillus proteolyticus]|uniref:glucuronate isomerase n=1 Tax=Jeotgalibacillus proteolyticus TaxID=2082395 RepID=UPI003CF4A4EA
MTSFIHEDFLLSGSFAKTLYHDHAKPLPIIDYHCHLPAEEIAENKPYSNLTQIWLNGDHYKWRAMRSTGEKEMAITGNVSDYEKFKAWARTVPACVGNPLYHWTHMELKRYFDIDLLLSDETSDEIWNRCNDMLSQQDFTPQQLITRFNVEMIGTTDDPLDELVFHKKLKKQDGFKTEVLPSFRPDPLLDISQPAFQQYVNELQAATQITISQFDDFLSAVKTRIGFFHEHGCRVSDHGFEFLPFKVCTHAEAAAVFEKAKEGIPLTDLEIQKYKTYTLLFLGEHYHSLDWVMQLHIGALRNTNARKFDSLGSNTGFDSINDYQLAKPLNAFLNELDKHNQLPKTIIYSLNPIHNYIVASAAGNFQDENVKGKVQMGAGWWFNDTKDGILAQMTDLSNVGLLSNFIGMLTDSRSFLSFPRHEYFRRILCNMIGEWVEKGELPRDQQLLGKLVEDISYFNARQYFNVTQSSPTVF